MRDAVPIYGSGGFTSYDVATRQRQLGGWASAGFRAVKMKVGRDPAADPARVAAARTAIGPNVALFVDGNGGYDVADAAARASVCDVLQADATRCGGYTGLLAIDGFCDVTRKPLSTHCSPMLRLHVAAAALRLRHLEWFVDHVRIERMFFEGFVEPIDGALRPDRSRPGHGLILKESDARPYLREHRER